MHSWPACMKRVSAWPELVRQPATCWSRCRMAVSGETTDSAGCIGSARAGRALTFGCAIRLSSSSRRGTSLRGDLPARIRPTVWRSRTTARSAKWSRGSVSAISGRSNPFAWKARPFSCGIARRAGGVRVLTLSRPQRERPALDSPATLTLRGKRKPTAPGPPSLPQDLDCCILQKWKPNSAVSVRGVTKCVPLKVDRKL